MNKFIKDRAIYWGIILIGIIYIASLHEEVTTLKYNEVSLRGALSALREKLFIIYEAHGNM